MAVKRGLNMAKGLESLIPQGKAAENPGRAKKADTGRREEEKRNIAASPEGERRNIAASQEAETEPVRETKRTTARSSGEAVEKTQRKASGEAVEKTQRKASGEAVEKTQRKASGEAGEKTQRKASGEAVEKTQRKASGEAGKKTQRKSSGEAAGKTQREAAGKPAGKAQSAKGEKIQDAPPLAEQPVELSISQVIPNKSQPRTLFDDAALEELAESIRQFGVIQPLLVQKSGRYFEIIAGERRWRAAKLAGLKKVPVIIREFTNQEVVEISLIENIQREDLNAIEEARAYKRLLEEFDLKQEEVAQRVSKSRSAVTNALRLLNLDERVQEMLIADTLSAGHARALLSLEQQELQYTAAQKILEKGLSVRETEKLVKGLLKPRRETRRDPVDTQLESAFRAIEEQLTERVGSKVTIQRGRGTRGKIEIEYYSQDDLERIIDLIR